MTFEFNAVESRRTTGRTGHMPQRTKKFHSEAACGLAVTRSEMGN
jgi:hypothetical protein